MASGGGREVVPDWIAAMRVPEISCVDNGSAPVLVGQGGVPDPGAIPKGRLADRRDLAQSRAEAPDQPRQPSQTWRLRDAANRIPLDVAERMKSFFREDQDDDGQGSRWMRTWPKDFLPSTV